MQGNDNVLDRLQQLLNNELGARDQYLAHSRKYRDWGLDRLYRRLDHEMQEETEHADALIERMLFLGRQPDLNQQDRARVGSDVREMLQNDLDVEYEVAEALKAAIAVCEQERDFDTRRILVKLLDDTEMDHAYWLEQQLELIDRIGLGNYLQTNMRAGNRD